MNHPLDASADRAGLGTMVLMGVVLSAVINGAGLLLVGLLHGFHYINWAFVIGLAVVVLLPGAFGLALWGRHPEPAMRSLALGFCTGSGITLVTLLTIGLRTGFDPSAMNQGEIDEALDDITKAHHPAVYLGDEADGKKLANITKQFGVLYFNYGRCLDNGEGDCLRPLNVTNQPTNTWGSLGETHGMSCERLRPVLGVPAAHIAGSLTVFTGSSLVSIDYYKVVSNGYVNDEPRQTSLAPKLRSIGEPTTVKTLPAPDRATQAFVDQHCGPAPGDKSRLP